MNRIFIQIASYRDRELRKTISDALSKAADPARLRFGICHQRHPDDAWDNLDEWKEDPRFRIDSVDSRESRGTCWARARVHALYDGEEYTLQLDAHHRFAQDWDDRLIAMLQRCPSEKPILTSYMPEYNAQNEKKPNALWMMTPHFPARDHVPTFMSTIRPEHSLRLHMFWSGHFSFSSGRFIEEVPYDPKLYFNGEEISTAVRAWTRGWDMFLPDECLVWHQYPPKGRCRHWNDHRKADTAFHVLDRKSKNRVRKLLIGPGLDGAFGVGTVRTLDEYENAAGICFSKNFVSKRAKNNAPAPQFSNSDWKSRNMFQHRAVLDWSGVADDLARQAPDKIAIFALGKRIDIDCEVFGGDRKIPLQRIMKTADMEETYSKFTIWPYQVDPLKWGEKHDLEINEITSIEIKE